MTKNTQGPTVYVGMGALLPAQHMQTTPVAHQGNGMASITTSGLAPAIPGGPVVQTAFVNGTYVQLPNK